MNLPIFEFYLNFVSLGFDKLYQIAEPSAFDAATFTMLQNPNRFSRDVSYGSDKKDLHFIQGNFELGENDQVKDQNGTISKFLDMGLNWIFESDLQYGYESKIEFIIKKNGLLFTTGLLDAAKRKTDGETYYSCAIIQNNVQADYKRHLDDTIDLFGSKNYLNEPITAVKTLDFLRKAISINKYSKLITPETFIINQQPMYGNDAYIFNPAEQLTEYGAQTTFNPSTNLEYISIININSLNDTIGRKLLFVAKKRTDNLRIKLSDLNVNIQVLNTVPTVFFNIQLYWGNDPVFPTASSGNGYHLFFQQSFYNQSGLTANLDREFTIPYLGIGQKVWFRMILICQGVPSATPVNTVYLRIENTFKIELFSKETSIDTIVKGVRYFEGLKQVSKYIKNLPIQSPNFGVGGKFYNQVIWNRSLISQKTDNKFNTSIKDLMGSVEEVAADYEVLKDKIFIGQYPEYHTDVEIGSFLLLPSENFEHNYADNAQLNTFKYGYETFEQDRDSVNTKEDFHTDSEWGIPNENVENKKEIKNKLVRSAFSQQVAADLEITKSNTSDSNDDKVYIAEIIELAPGSFNQFGAVLNQRFENGKLKILNRDSQGENEDVVVNWEILGINVGSAFQVLSGANGGMYTVFSITKTILTLTPTTANPDAFGDVFSEFKFFYTNILWKTRGNEGFTLVDGISNPDTYPNLLYSIRRNMKYWESYINRSCQYIQEKTIANRYFKNNPKTKTNYNNQGLVEEKGDILINTLELPLLSPKEFSLELVVGFEQMLILLERYEIDRGFIRCYSSGGKVVKGYIKKLDYVWMTGVLKLSIDEKYYGKTLLITFVNGVLSLNNTEYQTVSDVKWWSSSGNYFQFYDKNNKPIHNNFDYKNISLNSIIYNSKFELIEALNNL
ncbi:MAG: hypothetical protein LH615_04115 [Ferruginibacter sp.]|nr:hypothetical protein [Ferruginibacter sp.]